MSETCDCVRGESFTYTCVQHLDRRERRAAQSCRTSTYLVLDAPYVKIGRTINMKQRWKGRNTDNPRKLDVLAVLQGDHELDFHREFAQWNVGGEWFEDRPEIRAAFGIT